MNRKPKIAWIGAFNLEKEYPLNKSHVREWTYEEFKEILEIYFNDVKFYDYQFNPAKLDDTPLVAKCRNL